MTSHLLNRKGAPRISDIPPDVLRALNQGLLPTVNLTEFLAIDLAQLAQAVAGHIGLDARAQLLTDTLAMLPALKPMKRHDHVARALYDLAAAHPQRDTVAHALATHASDVARCWASQWVGFSGLDFADQLHAVRPFAADNHFGVREIAWMAVRDALIAAIAQSPQAAVALLVPWVNDGDENVRRFASELSRPRGVWCAQIEAFKTQPALALTVLEPLRADPSRYVQNSVANWLNDASKSQPRWVAQLCQDWRKASPSPHTDYIVRRALRTVNK
jgi:3-methyladenine DNA glycosylase AlkC